MQYNAPRGFLTEPSETEDRDSPIDAVEVVLRRLLIRKEMQ